MSANKPVSASTLKSDLARVDAHRLRPADYRVLPALTDVMLARRVVSKGGRQVSVNQRKLVLPNYVPNANPRPLF